MGLQVSVFPSELAAGVSETLRLGTEPAGYWRVHCSPATLEAEFANERVSDAALPDATVADDRLKVCPNKGKEIKRKKKPKLRNLCKPVIDGLCDMVLLDLED
jgi:hypothetical protein